MSIPTPPIASLTAAPPPNANGWNNTPVTVSFSGTDWINGSGVAGCTAPISLLTSGAGQLATGTCTDIAGNVSLPVTGTVNINLVPPTVAVVVPANNAGYPRGASLVATYICSDAQVVGADVSCQGTIVGGSLIDTSTVGSQSFSASSRILLVTPKL